MERMRGSLLDSLQDYSSKGYETSKKYMAVICMVGKLSNWKCIHLSRVLIANDIDQGFVLL